MYAMSNCHETSNLIVFKIGGSLLDLPNLPDALAEALDQRPGCAPLFIVGGGATADIVREWDAVHKLGDERAHGLALRAMALNELLLLDVWPALRHVRSRMQLEAACIVGKIPLLCTVCAVPALESKSGGKLPRTWRLTSDSIAAWVALHWQAAELVLLKSVPLPHNCTLHRAAELNLVDCCFSEWAAQLPRVGWTNLRAPEAITPLIDGGPDGEKN